MGLRWGDAGAEGLRAVLPAVDLLDGPDKDPLAGRRHAKPGGVERVNVSRFTGSLRQGPQKRVMVHIGHAGVLRAGAEDQHVLAGFARELKLE